MKTTWVLTALAVLSMGRAWSQSESGAHNFCGPLANAYGPYDYRTDKDRLPVVEQAHFPAIVENLIRGNRGYLGSDIDYTLRAFPNHHRALIAVMNYGIKRQTSQPKDLPRPVECYFDRAIRFRPLDPLPRMIFADFLIRQNRPNEAVAQLRAASEAPDLQPVTRQNIGLFLVEMKQYDLARTLAWRNMELGEMPDRLIGKLTEAGRWQAPPEPQSSGAASAPQ